MTLILRRPLIALLALALVGGAAGAASARGSAVKQVHPAFEEDSIRNAFHPDVVTRRSVAGAPQPILPAGPVIEQPTYLYADGNSELYKQNYLAFMDEMPVRLQVLDNAVARGDAGILMTQFDEIADYADQLELKWLLAVADSGAEAASKKDGPTVHLRCLELMDYIGRVDVRLPGGGNSYRRAKRPRGR